MAGEFFWSAGGERGLAENRDAIGISRGAAAAWPGGSAHGVLHGDDGMGAADASPAAVSRGGEGIPFAAGSAELSARRLLARLLPEISGGKPAAQEDAARLARVAGVPARPHDAKSSEELAKA